MKRGASISNTHRFSNSVVISTPGHVERFDRSRELGEKDWLIYLVSHFTLRCLRNILKQITYSVEVV